MKKPKTPKLPKLPKSKHLHALRTLAKIAELGEASADQIFAAMPDRSGPHCTFCRCLDLMTMGLVSGIGQHPDYAKGVPMAYEVTDLGFVILGWQAEKSPGSETSDPLF